MSCPAESHARLAVPLASRATVPVAVVFGLLVTTPARAASLSPAIAGYTTASVPAYVTMFEYVPAKLAAKPPIVVAAHYCGGSASAMFGIGVRHRVGGRPVRLRHDLSADFQQLLGRRLDEIPHPRRGGRHAGDRRDGEVLDLQARRGCEPRLRDGDLVRRDDDGSLARGLSRRLQGRRRVLRRAGRMLGGKLQQQQPVEQPLRGRNGHEDRAAMGGSRSRHVPGVFRLSARAFSFGMALRI